MSESIRRAQSHLQDPKDAIGEISEGLRLEDAALSVVFWSSKYDSTVITEELNKRAADGLVMGCTTSGEIGFDGYQNNSITGFSLPKEQFKASIVTIDDLTEFSIEQAENLCAKLVNDLQSQSVHPSAATCFALLLVDGLSATEETVAYKMQTALGEIPLVGGSAGDDLTWKETFVYTQGKLSTNSAILAIIHTDRPFEIIKEQAFSPSETKVVVTESSPGQRLIHEINGAPAATEFAELLSLRGPEELNDVIFAENPLMLQLGGEWLVRSLREVQDDGSISTYCGIDEGLVLSIANHENLSDSLRKKLDGVSERLGTIRLLIACDCIQRRQRAIGRNLVEETSSVFKEFNSIGFSTYGEQYGTVHVNQTLTAIAIG